MLVGGVEKKESKESCGNDRERNPTVEKRRKRKKAFNYQRHNRSE